MLPDCNAEMPAYFFGRSRQHFVIEGNDGIAAECFGEQEKSAEGDFPSCTKVLEEA